MKLSDNENDIYELYRAGFNQSQIARQLGLSSSAIRQKLYKAKIAKKWESEDPIAKLNIDYSTYIKFNRLRNMIERESKRNIKELYTIEGLINAVNDEFKIYNQISEFNAITPSIIVKLRTALKEAGYKLAVDEIDIGLNFTSDMICNRSNRYIEFEVYDAKGFFKCQSDATDCQVFLSRQSKYPREEIEKQILTKMKEAGYLI